MKKQPAIHETWNLSVDPVDGKIMFTISPEMDSGYEPKTIEFTEEQAALMMPLIGAGIPFRISHQYKEDENRLSFMAKFIDLGSKHNFQTIVVSPEQWDGLRFGSLSAINDRTGVTKLCYL